MDGSAQAGQQQAIDAYKANHPANGVYDGAGEKTVSRIKTPMDVVTRVGSYNHTAIEGGTITRKETSRYNKQAAIAGQYAKSPDDQFISPVDEEGLPAVDQQQQIDAWKARHPANGVWMGDGEKVTYSLKLPTKVIYKKPPPPPPPPPAPGGGGSGAGSDSFVQSYPPFHSNWNARSRRVGSGYRFRFVSFPGAVWDMEVFDESNFIIYSGPCGLRNRWIRSARGWMRMCENTYLNWASVWNGGTRHYRRWWFQWSRN